jgi:hypothetical protein
MCLDKTALLDHLVGAREQRGWHNNEECQELSQSAIIRLNSSARNQQRQRYLNPRVLATYRLRLRARGQCKGHRQQ